MRRALLVTLDYPPTRGGVSRFLASLRNRIPSHINVLTTPNQTPYDEPGVFRRDFLRLERFLFRRWWLLIREIVLAAKANKTHLLIAGQILPVGTAVALASRRLRIPYAIMVYGLDLLLATRNPWKRWLSRRVLFGAESVITISRFTETLLRSVGVSESSIIRIPPSAQRPPHRPSPADIERFRKRHHVHQGVLFLAVGRLVPRKGFDQTIRAFVQLQRDLPDASLIITGEGPERNALERLIQQLSPQPNKILLIGGLSDSDLQIAYEACDIFVLPAREIYDRRGRLIDAEGFGIVYLEANLAGKPVIAGHSGGVPDAVLDGKTGILVNPESTDEIKDAMLSLANNAELRERLGKEGQRVATDILKRDDASYQLRLLLGQTPSSLVSVVIPAFNAEQTILKTLDSLATQTYPNLEVIIVNDGSTDGTIKCLERSPIPYRLLTQSNRGASAARNRGFDESKAEYVLFCDADVIAKSTMIDRMVRTLELHPDAAYCYSNFRFGWHTFDLFNFDPERLRLENYISTMSLIRRSAFLRFNERLARYQDWDLWKRMLDQGSRGIWYPARLFSAPLRKGISKDSFRDLLRLAMHQFRFRRKSHD